MELCWQSNVLCFLICCLSWSWASLVAQPVKNLPAVQETEVQSQGWKDPLEKQMALLFFQGENIF